MSGVKQNGPKPKPVRERILANVKVDATGCWIWQLKLTPKGYGQIGIGSWLDNSRKMKAAHRLSYETFVGPIPEGLDLDHLCRVRSCVNPAHLEPVTRAENLRRGEALATINSRKTHCPRDHPYDDENTYHYNGQRHCRACGAARAARRKGRAA